MRKLLKSKKALSPVVAAIILIAVTVAVSIAVAAWMGSLTIGFMETSELTITDMTFVAGAGNGSITLSVTNSGTSDVTVSRIRVNGDNIASGSISGTVTYDAGASAADLKIDSITIVAGNKYSVSLFATDGTMIGSYEDTA
jgi:flagellin-like protein